MWISFIHLSPSFHVSIISLCWTEVWDPENFILLSKTPHGLSPDVDEACANGNALLGEFIPAK